MSTHRSLLQSLSIIVILTLLFSGFSVPAASAQEEDGLTRQINPQTGKVSFLHAGNGQAFSAYRALGTSARPQDPALALAKRFGSEFGLKDPQRELTALKTNRSEDGRITVHYQQQYQGIPVMGGELIVNTNESGDLYSMHGEVSPALSLSLQPAIDSTQARDIALQAAAKWYGKTSEDFRVTEPELWIYDESLLQPSTRPVELVWRMEVTSKEIGMPVRELVLVNAGRGSISLHFNQIDTVWSASGSSGISQDPTLSPVATETPLPTETPEPVVAQIPITEETSSNEKASARNVSISALSPLAALTWYVATTGNDSNSCSAAASPCATINGALAKAQAGDTIKVGQGTYYGTGLNVVTISKSITLSGGWNSGFSAQAGASVIDGEHSRRAISVGVGSSGSVYIDRFAITNGYSPIVNGVTSGGAGIDVQYSSLLNISNSLISGNEATASGGGIVAYNASLTIQNTTISGNKTDGAGVGGGIYFSNYGSSRTLNILNSTIAYNTAGVSGGGLYIYDGGSGGSGGETVSKSIIAYNTAPDGPECKTTNGGINSADHNLMMNEQGCSMPTGSNNPVDPIMASALVGSPGYYPLFSNSPAIDSGGAVCLSNDQRGLARPQGAACDIGAYERPATVAPTESALVILKGNGQRTLPNTHFPLPFSIGLINSNGDLVEKSGVSIALAAPNTGPSLVFDNNGGATTSVITDQFGVAAFSAMTANSQSGSYTVLATSSGLPSVNINLQNVLWYVAPDGNNLNTCESPVAACATIGGVLTKSSFVAGDMVKLRAGTYTASTDSVVTIDKSVHLSGGWNTAFDAQTGFSTIDGQNSRRGIYNTSKNTIIDHFIVQNGYTRFSGGGIYNYVSGSITVSNSLIINNKAINGGGGVHTEGSLTLDKSTIEGNLSSYDGGGIEVYVLSGSLTLNNTTVAKNQAYRLGGAIALDYSSGGSTPGMIAIQNSTLVYNSASRGGGLSNGGGSSRAVNISNSIIANNTASTLTGVDCSGQVTSSNHNIVGNIGDCTITAGAGDLFSVDPRLPSDPSGALHYYVLLSNSSAIDAGGNCLSTDQKGTPRPQGIACDIGSYEYVPPGPPSSFGVASGSDQRTGPLLSFSLPFAVYVVDGFENPVSGVPVTFVAPGSGASGTFADTHTNTTTAISNNTGLAISSIFTANSQEGTYHVLATIPNVSGSAEFTLANTSLFVSPTGNDSNPCSTAALPCRTMNGAINKALGGELIKVASGTYTGTASPVVNVTKGVTISGGWDDSFRSQTGISIIDGNANAYHGMTLNTSGHVTISKFKIQNSFFGIENNGSVLDLDKVSLTNNKNGLRNLGGPINITNSTVSGNTGGTYTGSAIYSVFAAVNIQYSTIANNISTAIWIDRANVKFGNSIIAGNSGGDCGISSSVMESDGYNIFGSQCTNYSSSINLAPTDRVGINPKLLPLISDGYHPILPGSPAYNAANALTCPSTDQRNVERPVGSGCEIGAFEYRGNGVLPAYIFIYQGTPQTIAIEGVNRTPLQVVVLDKYGDSVSGATVTFSAPSNGATGVFTDTDTGSSTSITDADGIATSFPFRANATIGSYTITASVTGVAAPAQFQITNVARAKTYTANHSPTTLPGALLCDGNTINCTNGSNPAADAAHKYAIGTASWYITQFDRDSLDNHGMTIISTMDYCAPYGGCPYANVFWNGTQIVYGDAYGYALADDVVAHEITHGVTQYESNLFYYYQSGAINESFSDLWGEYYDQTNGLGTDSASVRWQVGEDVSGLNPVRNMSNPPVYGDPDKMSSPNYRKDEVDSGGIHHNSGVNNKAVTLMVDGGSFNGKTVSALGWMKTAAIYYEVNTNLLSSGADYSDLYYALQQACTDLIGQKDITVGDCAEVKDAIDAVEMNTQPAPNFNSDAPYCDAGMPITTIFSDDLETGTGNWTFSNGYYPRWQWDSPYGPYAQSGLHSLYADDYPAAITDASARLKSFVVPSNAYLRFAQAYDFEAGYQPNDPSFYNFDGGVLEYSLDNGISWIDAGSLIDYNGYKGAIHAGSNNPLRGRTAFVGSSHGYIGTRLNLYSLVGQIVSFRWRMGLDSSYSAWGWWVDNIQLFTCPVILNRDTTGVFRPDNGLLYLKNSNTTGFADAALNYGLPGDYPVVGDWDGNGTVTIGIYRQGTFYLRNSNTIGFAEIVVPFGQPGDQPVAGDWDGNGVDTIGVFRPANGNFLLRDSNSEGPAQMDFFLGNPGDVGVAGDWNGDGKDTTGVFRPSNGLIYLKDQNTTGFADYALNYGLPGDRPVMGDWNDDGIDTIGIYRNGQFYLRNSNTIGFAEIIFGLGIPGDMPIAGNWDGLP